ncbi:MAG: hypothetical protein QM479_11215 [Pseudomonadota bacterium]
MNIVLFSKDQGVREHWLSKLNSLDFTHYNGVISCTSYKELGNAIEDKNHILLYHLLAGDAQEKICYQFISKYQQQHKMIVFVNAPDASQGLRIFRSGIHGYSNTFLDQKKLLIAIDVIEQGKVWIGSKILAKLLKDCGLDEKVEHKSTNKESIQKETAEAPQQEIKTNLLGSLVKGFKKLFSKYA